MNEDSTAETPPAAPTTLRQQVVSGIGWKVATQVVSQTTRIVVGIALARLLVPRDYGLASMALLFVGVASVFTDLSFGQALIARRTITEHDRSTAFWSTLAAGAACAGGGVAAAPLVADFFSAPAVTHLFAVTSILFVITSFSSTQIALLTREMRFRSLQLREMAGTVIGGGIGVALALGGLGAWALVVQAIAAEAVSLVLVWRFSAWRPRLTYSKESLRRLGSFAGKTSGARVLGYVNLNADNFLIARFLGAAPLGVYAVAYNVMFAPLARLAAPIQQVLFPAFALISADPQRAGAAWLRGNRIVAAISVPAFVGLAVVAPDFVPVVLGHRWHQAIPVLQLLCIAGLSQSLQSLNHSMLQALDRAGALLAFMIFSATLTVSAFAIGLHWGVVGVAAGFAAARTTVLPVFTTIVARAAQTPVLAFASSVRPVLEVSAAMGALAYGARLALVHAGVAAGFRLAVVVAAGAVFYVALLLWRESDLVTEIWALVRRRGR
ncbi:MAG TPA: MOP flippase family protein [Gaiellaceae bacterium]|nr:MOP flippase family protein [Gaiellaceae bacterium]